MSTTHNKHSKLARPVKGNFHRCEWAIMGTNCTSIQKLANLIIQQLQDKFNGGFLDMKHDDESHQEYFGRTIIEHGDRGREIKTSGYNPSIPFTDWTAEDFVLINGNHYAAQKQIIVTDPTKENSLRKRIEQLTDVGLLLLTTENEIPPYIKDILPYWDKIPSLHINETEKIAEYLFHEITNQLPPIKALVWPEEKAPEWVKTRAKFAGMVRHKNIIWQICSHNILMKFTFRAKRITYPSLTAITRD